MLLSLNCYFPDDESGEKSVSVLLNGEESELTFIDHSTAEMSVSIIKYYHFVGKTKINETNGDSLRLLKFRF